MRLAPLFFRWHRWFGYLVALQVLAWVGGGLVFAWLPFQAWVKGGELVAKPRQPLPAGWDMALAGSSDAARPLLEIKSVATARGPALRLLHADGEEWLSAGGGELAPPDAAAIAAYARTLHKAGLAPVEVRQMATVPPRLGLVQELGDRRHAWLARFDDALGTRLYFDGRSGELLAVRNEAWVWYDFFFRLHVMDYGGGEDFNNPLLRAASAAALLLVASGMVLLTLALARAWKRRRAPQRV
ncbi:conserved hypothetical protein [Rubrivivax sp. A210]|uniref:PepSY domain-containing protein n=1 Tax=Rubrivivax sp. A210 TaxID=2772301 RepID=UPI00191A02EC|nr:PepSY domain-containing protein [Rubrivivax sp. A210]CAD5373302.1 conserved hypothetical protein [Rubrivivax sp. A210]